MMRITPEVFNIVVYVWIGIAVVIFPVLLKVTAPYGRHTKKNWGPMINNRLGWVIMELPSLLVFSWFLLSGTNTLDILVLIVFILWASHYAYRSVVFPLRIKTGRKKMPLLIAVFAIFFNLMNASINGYWFGTLAPAYPNSWLADPRFILGVILFFIGFSIHMYHDHLLIQLRENNPGEYRIPHGGLFRFISCPNFFGEIIEWGGFALLTWCLPAFSFFLWTFVNLVPRALDHHRWYRQKFENYPEERKAIVPFVF